MSLNHMRLLGQIIILYPKFIQQSAMDRMMDDLGIDRLGDLSDFPKNRKIAREFDYKIYKEICISCLNETGLQTDRVAEECKHCYDEKKLITNTGKEKLRRLGLLYKISSLGLRYHYLSQIIYQLLNKEPIK